MGAYMMRAFALVILLLSFTPSSAMIAPPAPWFFGGQFTVGNILFIIWIRESPYQVRITELYDKIKGKSQLTRLKMAMSYLLKVTGLNIKEFMVFQDFGRSRHTVDRSTKLQELMLTVEQRPNDKIIILTIDPIRLHFEAAGVEHFVNTVKNQHSKKPIEVLSLNNCAIPIKDLSKLKETLHKKISKADAEFRDSLVDDLKLRPFKGGAARKVPEDVDMGRLQHAVSHLSENLAVEIEAEFVGIMEIEEESDDGDNGDAKAQGGDASNGDTDDGGDANATGDEGGEEEVAEESLLHQYPLSIGLGEINDAKDIGIGLKSPSGAVADYWREAQTVHNDLESAVNKFEQDASSCLDQYKFLSNINDNSIDSIYLRESPGSPRAMLNGLPTNQLTMDCVALEVLAKHNILTMSDRLVILCDAEKTKDNLCNEKFEVLLVLILAGKVRNVVIKTPDRISSNPDVVKMFVRLCEKKGVEVVFSACMEQDPMAVAGIVDRVINFEAIRKEKRADAWTNYNNAIDNKLEEIKDTNEQFYALNKVWQVFYGYRLGESYYFD